MLRLLLAISCILLLACSESFTDPRDGSSYKVTHIGNVQWMAENLSYDMNGSSCPEGDKRNCSKYGRLYIWEDAQKACPEGWRLPDSTDFEKLLADVGGATTAGRALKSTSGWFKKKNGTDDFGFDAIPAGFRKASGAFDGIGGYAHFWSATSTPDGLAYYILVEFGGESAQLNAYGKDEARSVRCIKK